MPSAKPKKVPTGADFSALVKKVNELATKAGISPLSATVTGRIPLWKRYVGSEGPEYAAAEDGGLKAVINANAIMLDGVKGDLDNFRENQGIAHNSINTRLAALEEAVQHPPFPG